jgi:SAM-dependent methyltransferase
MQFFKEFKPKKIKKCDIAESRAKFKRKKNNNVLFLLEKRFFWMKPFLKKKKNIIELGSGNGASKEILKNKKIILTDIQKYPWIKLKVDMNKIKLKKNLIRKVDVFILNQALHHCANPSKLLRNLARYLKKDGLILIREPEISFFLRFFLYILDDEAWSFNVNVFNFKKNLFDPNSPWDANNAIPRLLFANQNKFYKNFKEYEIIKNELSEFFIFLNSSGVVQETFHVPVNRSIFNLLFYIDKILIFLFPSVFALARTVVLKKIR